MPNLVVVFSIIGILVAIALMSLSSFFCTKAALSLKKKKVKYQEAIIYL